MWLCVLLSSPCCRYRGHLGRIRAQERRDYLHNLLEHESATVIQAIVRGFVGRVTAKRVYEAQRQAIAVRYSRNVRAEVRRNERAALAIQCAVRQWFARRAVYMRRQEGYITHPRVRALADLYLSRGDLWGMLAAMNEDYEQQERDRLEEQTNAGVFLKEVLRVREFQERKEWGMWNRAHATLPGASPTKGSVTRMQAGTALAQEMGRGFMNPKVCSGAGREPHCGVSGDCGFIAQDPLNESLYAPFESTNTAEASVYEVCRL